MIVEPTQSPVRQQCTQLKCQKMKWKPATWDYEQIPLRVDRIEGSDMTSEEHQKLVFHIMLHLLKLEGNET